jgi:hypothetical protein
VIDSFAAEAVTDCNTAAATVVSRLDMRVGCRMNSAVSIVVTTAAE